MKVAVYTHSKLTSLPAFELRRNVRYPIKSRSRLVSVEDIASKIWQLLFKKNTGLLMGSYFTARPGSVSLKRLSPVTSYTFAEESTDCRNCSRSFTSFEV